MGKFLSDLQFDMPAEPLLQEQACPLHDNHRCQFWPVETAVVIEEAFGQPGGPAAQGSLRAGNRSVHWSVRQEEGEEEEKEEEEEDR